MAGRDVPTKTLEQFSIKNTNIYIGNEAVDISSTDHTFTKNPIRGLHITVAGNVKYDTVDGSTITQAISAIPAVGYLDMEKVYITKVYKTGTTATVAWGWA